MEVSLISNILQQVIDKVITFRDRKIKSNERILNEILDPLFNDLIKVVENYFEIFQTAKILILDNPGNHVRSTVDEISKLRNENLVGRIKIRELIQILGDEYNNPYLKDFAQKTEKFFYSSEHVTQKMSAAKELVFDLQEYIKQEEVNKGLILDHIDLTMQRMEENWSSIVQNYAHIRIKLIKARVNERIK